MGGIDFVRADPELHAVCVDVAAELRFPTLCPTVIPARVDPASPGCDESYKLRHLVRAPCLPDRRYQFATWGLEDDDDAHIILVAVPGRASLQKLFYPAGRPERTRVRRVGSALIRGRQATQYRIEEAPFSAALGHTLLTWREAGATYGVSFHGWSAETRELNEFLARNTTAVEPPRP